MTLQLNVRGQDLEKAAHGVWILYEDEIEFCIARANTPEYRDALRKITRQNKRQLEMGTMSEAKSDAIMADLMAEHILAGWKGLYNAGEEFPYNRENAIAFLSDPQYADIKEWIMMQAQDAENYRKETLGK